MADIAKGSQLPFAVNCRPQLSVDLEAPCVHQLVLEQGPKQCAISVLSRRSKGNRSSESYVICPGSRRNSDQTRLTLAGCLSCGILPDLSLERRFVPQWRFPFQTTAARGKKIDLRSEESQKTQPLTRLRLRTFPGAECDSVGRATQAETTSQTIRAPTELSMGICVPYLKYNKMCSSRHTLFTGDDAEFTSSWELGSELS